MSDIFEILRSLNLSNDSGNSGQTITHIIVGLGNPGEKYMYNRHNVGFMCIDYLMQKYNFKVNKLKFRAMCGEAVIADKRVLVMKPQTYMNDSGSAIHEAAEYYKIPGENIIVLYDDMSLEVGRMRVRLKGSAGGHNGIKSVIRELGSDVFPRIKYGVGTPPEGEEIINWVLGDLSKADRELLFADFEKTPEAIELLLRGENDKAMQSVNAKSEVIASGEREVKSNSEK